MVHFRCSNTKTLQRKLLFGLCAMVLLFGRAFSEDLSVSIELPEDTEGKIGTKIGEKTSLGHNDPAYNANQSEFEGNNTQLLIYSEEADGRMGDIRVMYEEHGVAPNPTTYKQTAVTPEGVSIKLKIVDPQANTQYDKVEMNIQGLEYSAGAPGAKKTATISPEGLDLIRDGDASATQIRANEITTPSLTARRINATEVVATPKWKIAPPDYVFDSTYELKSLEALEKYLREEKHLPEIPSGETMVRDGINIADMNIALLKKVEEITLYLVEMNKQMKAQKAEIDRLNALIEDNKKVD